MEGSGVRWHASYQDMLDSSGLDAVTIAAPIHLHFEMARACARSGLFVNLEKPAVPMLRQLDELIAVDKNRRIAVNFQRIGSQTIQEAKSFITQGHLGTPLEIHACGAWPRHNRYYERARWAGRMMLDGDPVFDGPATNALAHVIHHIMYLAAPGRDRFDIPAEIQGEVYRAHQIESYDVACLRGRFASGVKFSATLTHATEEEIPFRVEVKGSKDYVLISDNGDLLQTSSRSLRCSESFVELMERGYRQFVRFVQGVESAPTTYLDDTRGYVCATNGMLRSSGGIHDIPPRWVRNYRAGDQYGLDVEGLSQAVEAAFQKGAMLSELDLPWSVKSPVIAVCDLSPAELDGLGADELGIFPDAGELAALVGNREKGGTGGAGDRFASFG